MKNDVRLLSPDQAYELGTLYSDRCDFEPAIQNLLAAADGYSATRDFSGYLRSQNLLLRIYGEMERFDRIQEVKERLQDLVLKEGFELGSRTYYTLSLCAAYRGQNETALEYLQKSLAIALATDHKEDICFAINGLAICYSNLGKSSEALKEIYNLQVFLQVLDLPEVRISSQILNAKILREAKRFDQALEVLWQTYEYLRSAKALNRHIYILYELGRTYLLSGDKDLARTYLTLASKTVDPKNMIRLARMISDLMKELGADTKSNFDLIFALEDHAVTEKKLGRIDFKNQFILLDLLRLFVQNPGQVYSKEYLVENIWKQSYDPGIHDNKIYVTIKRLRKMIEPDYERPKYIFRAKNGYFMNKSAKVLMDQRGELQ